MATTAVENDLHTVSVELPRKHRELVLPLVGALLVIWERYSLWNKTHPYDPITGLGFILFTIGAILISMTFCWRAWARHWIRVSPYELTFDITALGLHQIRRYPRSEVSNLRVDEQRVFTYRPWLAVDRNGKRKFLGNELERSKLEGLLEPIYSQFPDIAPEARTQTHRASI